jgi:dihydroorotate dehydrogenase (fumarate)
MPHFQRAADIINSFPVRFVVCTNTIGNALIIDAEKEEAVIAPKEGFGGLGGGCSLPPMLGDAPKVFFSRSVYRCTT